MRRVSHRKARRIAELRRITKRLRELLKDYEAPEFKPDFEKFKAYLRKQEESQNKYVSLRGRPPRIPHR